MAFEDMHMRTHQKFLPIVTLAAVLAARVAAQDKPGTAKPKPAK